MEGQNLIFFLDMRYSHSDEMMLELMRLNYVILMSIPAGSRDLHQVCDLVMNRPYKNGITKAVANYLTS